MAGTADATCRDGERAVAVIDQGETIEASSLPSSDPFRRFVEGVSPAIGGRTNVPAGRLELRFERRRLGVPGRGGKVSAADGRVRFDSPWLQVRRFDDPCRVEATFVWDERQIVVDQALLWHAEAAVDDPRARLPAKPDVLARWLGFYEAAAFRGSPAERERRVAELEGRIPFDMLWLFRNSSQATRGPFAGYVADDFANLQDRTEPAYRALAAVLLARATFAAGEPVAIRDIRQTSGFFDVGSLRVGTIR